MLYGICYYWIKKDLSKESCRLLSGSVLIGVPGVLQNFADASRQQSVPFTLCVSLDYHRRNINGSDCVSGDSPIGFLLSTFLYYDYFFLFVYSLVGRKSLSELSFL